MKEKRFKTIKEVSDLLNLNSHVIRYWDSKFEGLSVRLSPKGQRFFNSENIKKLQNLKLTLYNNGKHNYSLDLAKKILNTKNKDTISNNETLHNKIDLNNLKSIRDNLKKLLN